jgi:hypothetical protein
MNLQIILIVMLCLIVVTDFEFEDTDSKSADLKCAFDSKKNRAETIKARKKTKGTMVKTRLSTATVYL